MKLSLNELQVDSYATQVNEREVTEIKGGTTPIGCVPLSWIIIAESLLSPPKPAVVDSSLLPTK